MAQAGEEAANLPSITYAEAVEGALCYGWIDGQAASCDRRYWLQKFTPRGPKSHGPQVNRDKVGVLQAAGKMRDAGLGQVELAQAHGRWEAASAEQKKAGKPHHA